MTQYRNSKWINLTAAAALLLAVLILFQFLYQKDNKYTNGPPYGSQGIFAFSARDLTGSRPLFLIDGWEFYPDQLLTPDTIGSAPDQSVSFIFIGQYSNFSFLSSGHSPFGRATYRLLLQYDGEPRLLTLEVPELFTDYQLWINGQPVEQGSPFAAFYMDGTAEILLNTDNRSHYYSGLTYPPALGTPEAVHRMLFLRHMFYGILCIFPLALCLYAAAAWRIRDRDRRLIHFGLLCLFFSIHCAYPFIHQLGLSGRLWYAVEDVSWMAMLYEVIVLSSVEAGFSGKLWYRRFLRPAAAAACAVCGLSVLFLIPASPRLVNLYGAFLDGYKLLIWLYLLECAVYGLWMNRDSAGLVLAGCLTMGAAMVSNLLDNNQFEPVYTGWQTEYSGFILVIIFWILTVRHISRVLKQNQALTEHLEDQVQKRTRELHAVLDERKAFFSDLAHNLKAPVVAIHGFTDLILRGNLYLDDDLKEYLDKISSENEELCRRMYVLGDLNAFDKITEPRELIEINGLLSQVSHDNKPEACISGIELRVEKLEDQAFILAQKRKLLLLFENLIYNAISFTPEDGLITISPCLDQDGVTIRVSDTGMGIEPEHLPHIFERFYSGRPDASESSGLGLYIARITVEELGGSIHAESVKGQGSVFTVRIPLAGTVPSL